MTSRTLAFTLRIASSSVSPTPSGTTIDRHMAEKCLLSPEGGMSSSLTKYPLKSGCQPASVGYFDGFDRFDGSDAGAGRCANGADGSDAGDTDASRLDALAVSGMIFLCLLNQLRGLGSEHVEQPELAAAVVPPFGGRLGQFLG